MAEGPLALVQQFLREQCYDWRTEEGPGSRGNHQGIRELGQEWQAWLLVHGYRAIRRRAWRTPWLKERLVELGHKIANYHGSVVVCDLTLSSRRPVLLPERLADGASLSSRSLETLPIELAKHVPLHDATALHRPPDEEIIRRFLAECCDYEEPRPRLVARASTAFPAGSRRSRPRSPYATRGLFLSITHAFKWWATRQGARPSLLRVCHTHWLKRHLLRRGYDVVHDGSGLVYLGGITVKPAIAAQVPEQPRVVRGKPRPTKADRNARLQAYLATKEYKARLAAGFSEAVARDAFSIDFIPDLRTVRATQVRITHRQRLADDATHYIQTCLVADPHSRLRWKSLSGSFRAYLTTRLRLSYGAPGALAEALSVAGASLERSAKNGSLLWVQGFRYRVSSAGVENQDHAREVVGYAAGGSPFD